MSRYGLWALIGPASWPIWCLIAGTFVLWLKSARVRFARRALGAALLLVLVIYVLPAGDLLMRPLEARYPALPLRAVRGTDIVMLAGGERLGESAASGQPNYGEHGERMTEAAALAQALPQARLWAVGGIRRHRSEKFDADWTALAWLRLGVAPDRIVRVTDTLDTCGNAAGVAARLPRGARLILVTSAFHMPRAMACFHAVGLEPVPFPVDWQSQSFDPSDPAMMDVSTNARRFSEATHEYVGLVYYRLSGRTRELWPRAAR
ncbi:MAG: YdcF family protein [Sphingomonadaceae bacterium]|nr:YdcF family protein [Sphingomonadaceae bacterium]